MLGNTSLTSGALYHQLFKIKAVKNFVKQCKTNAY